MSGRSSIKGEGDLLGECLFLSSFESKLPQTSVPSEMAIAGSE